MSAFFVKIMAFFVAIISLLTLLLNKKPPVEPPVTDDGPSTEEEKIAERAEDILSEMTLEEKIGQLFIVAPEALQIQSGATYSHTQWNDEMTSALKKYPVGGIIMFAGNISTPEQIVTYTSDIQKSSKYPMFIAVDEEGGRVARIARNSNFDVPTYKSMEAVGATCDANNAYLAGKNIGAYVKKYGFNVDFAPVADINTNPNNIVIGNRAFGSDPAMVSDMVSSAIEGFHDSGMITCMKHFPGHGDTVGDTHTGYVSVTKTWEELKNCELIPYINAAETTDMIMAAHITLPNVSSDGLPASLSKEILTDKLRGELGYDGIIITDSLSMGAIIQNYTSEESTLKAFQAGADILLMPQNYVTSFNAVLKAVKNGTVTQERIDESVTRILTLKLRYGIME